MYKRKILQITAHPRRCGKSTRAKELSQTPNSVLLSHSKPLLHRKSTKNYFADVIRGSKRVIIDDLDPSIVLEMITDHSHPINLVDEVIYFHTFGSDPKNSFVAYINRTWDITLEHYTKEAL